MQLVFSESSNRLATAPPNPLPFQPQPNHGLQASQNPGSGSGSGLRSPSPRSPSVVSESTSGVSSDAWFDSIDIERFNEQLRRLNVAGHPSGDHRRTLGQRVIDHENALSPIASLPRRRVGFKIIERVDGASSDGPNITDFPNEVLTHILSYLHPESYAAMALVSKQFYALVKTPHAWKLAFQRLYSMGSSTTADISEDYELWDDSGDDAAPTAYRYFNRLTNMATWQSEYILRSQLLRGLANGRPSGAVNSAGQPLKRSHAVRTYDSKVPCVITNVYATFPTQKLPPKAIHGGADLGLGSMSNPLTGQVEPWGLKDVQTLAQVDDLAPNLALYGTAEGPAANPNIMDVSPTYGFIVGEGFPGGLPYFRPALGKRARYIDHATRLPASFTEIPPSPSLVEAISSVWIAKSSAVPLLTRAMMGVMTGSTLGVLTSYALDRETARRRFQDGDMACRWALCPGVPIVSIKVDENYSAARRDAGRVWAVVLNALGEVFYLKDIPEPVGRCASGDEMIRNAWRSGRTVHWHLLEGTRREMRTHINERISIPDGGILSSPRSSSNLSNPGSTGLVDEAVRITAWLNLTPTFFKDVYRGWDMRRRLEVDFAADDGSGAGEAIFFIDCGYSQEQPVGMTRYTRHLHSSDDQSPATNGAVSAHLDEWSTTPVSFGGDNLLKITSSAMDMSNCCLTTSSEDPLIAAEKQARSSALPSAMEGLYEIPGGRARFLAVGTDKGSVMVWNARDPSTSSLSLVKVIHTDSPEVTCIGLTALYLVHGGSDGLAQAWDPLSSSKGPIRTINARSGNRVPRHLAHINPGLRNHQYAAATSICMDPDPTKLRGVVSFGAFIRSWSYSSGSQPSGRKRSKFGPNGVKGSKLEALDPDEESARENWLRKKFGPGDLGDLTEEESILYALMMSEESHLHEEIRRAETSDTGSFGTDTFEASSPVDAAPAGADSLDIGAVATEPPDTASLTEFQAEFYSGGDPFVDDYLGEVPASLTSDSGEFGFPVTYKKKGKKSKKPASGQASSSRP